MARFIITFFILLISLFSYGQEGRYLSLLGSYQSYDLKAFSFGVNYTRPVVWPKVSFESNYEIKNRVQFFNDDRIDGKKAIASRHDIYWARKFIGAGISARYLFSDGIFAGIGPAIKLSYKYFSIEYSAYLFDEIISSDNLTSKTSLKNRLHTINLTLSIPIIDLKK